jgi:opacity protein-like surface antigen
MELPRMHRSNAFVLPLVLALTSGCAGTRHAAQFGIADLGSDYEPVDQQVSVGWSMNHHAEESGIGYEVGAQVAGDTANVQGVDITSANFELYGGPRYEWVLDSVRPYLSGGLSLLTTDLEGRVGNAGVTDNDTTIGLYLGGGVDFDITERFFMGVGLRTAFGHEPELFGVEGDAAFTQLFLRVGSSF